MILKNLKNLKKNKNFFEIVQYVQSFFIFYAILRNINNFKRIAGGDMAARLTDRKKKKIIADYVQFGNYNAVGKMNGVSGNTVKKVVKENSDIARKCEQKKEENTTDILEYMERQKSDVCEVLKICLAELKKPEKYEETKPQQIATTMAILIDKYTANVGASITDEHSEDELSKSLRELGEGLKSDD